MTLSRQQLRVLTAKARYLADKAKPPTRKQAKTWLSPIRDAIAEMRTGEVDAIRGYAVTRRELVDAANLEQMICEVERLGLDKVAA